MTSVEVTEKIVRTEFALRNYLRITNANAYYLQGSTDIEDVDAGVIIPVSWRQEVNNCLVLNIIIWKIIHPGKRENFETSMLTISQALGQFHGKTEWSVHPCRFIRLIMC